MSDNKFVFNKIETRNVGVKGKYPKYVIRGYAGAPDVPHVYQVNKDKNGRVVDSFKSLFTKNAINSFAEQFKYRDVFADMNHEVAGYVNSNALLDNIKKHSSPDVLDDIEAVRSSLKMTEFPLLTPKRFEVKESGLYFEIETNPYFAEVDESHAKIYEAYTKSLLDGYFKGASVNFGNVKTTTENGLDKIDDADFYGISLVPNPSLGKDASIVEVAMRSIQTREVETMEKSDEVKKEEPQQATDKVVDESKIDEMVNSRVEKLLEEKLAEKEKQQEEREKEEKLNEYKRQVEELQKKVHAKSEEKTGESKQEVPQARPPVQENPDEVVKEYANDLSPVDVLRLERDGLTESTMWTQEPKPGRNPLSMEIKRKPTPNKTRQYRDEELGNLPGVRLN